jgi:hypothetical protein
MPLSSWRSFQSPHLIAVYYFPHIDSEWQPLPGKMISSIRMMEALHPNSLLFVHPSRLSSEGKSVYLPEVNSAINY